MDFSWITAVNFNLDFWSTLLSIVIIDLVLSGDNAVVIALAVRSVPREQRLKSIIIGSGAAVMLRVVLTFFAVKLLTIPYLQLIGGILIIWIAVKLFLKGSSENNQEKSADSFFSALRIIMAADFVMSIDNVIAIAAASKGSLFLLIIGLALSIPIVVGTSTFLSKLMDRYPVIITIGAAVLGKVGGEMIVSDPAMIKMFNPSRFLSHAVELFFVVGVVITGKLLARRQTHPEESSLCL